MKTTLPPSITTVEEAQAFLTELHKNGEHFHPEDDAHDIIWENLPHQPTYVEETHLNELMHQIYALPGNDGRHTNLAFDPSEWLNQLDAIKVLGYEDDRVFTWGDMCDFATRMVEHAKANPGMTYDETTAYIMQECQYEEGDGSYQEYVMPLRPEQTNSEN